MFRISAASNRLKKVPDQISKFPSIFRVDLSVNQITELLCNDGKSFIHNNRLTNGTVVINLAVNEITRIPSGAFNFPFAYSVDLSLHSNKIASIAQDAFFFPSAKSVEIYMVQNKISSIPNGIFNYPAAIYGVYIYLSGSFEVISSAAFNSPLAINVFISLNGNFNSIPLDF